MKPKPLVNSKSKPANARIGSIALRIEELEADLLRVKQSAQDLADANEVLIQAAERFQNLFQELPIPTFSYDANGNLLEWNKAFATHQSFQDVPLDRPVWDVLAKPGIWPESREIIKRVIGGEFIQCEECECKLSNGVIAPVLYSAFPLRSLDGHIIGGIGTYFDISELKRSEQERTNHARQQAAIMELGQRALNDGGLAALFDDACRKVQVTLRVNFTIALELVDGGPELSVLAGCGWPEGVVGSRISPNENSANLFNECTTFRDFNLDLVPMDNARDAASMLIEAARGEIADEPRFPAWDLLTEHKITSGISIVISEEGRSFGSIGAYTSDHRSFTDQEVNFLQAIGNVLASALQRERSGRQIEDYMAVLRDQKHQLEAANSKLQHLATVNGLTGLKNHRYFQERLAEEFHISQTQRKPLSLMLLDVDLFKSYNDAFGHPQGDEVLRSVASLLAQHSRGSDTVARYGGEEFVVILPGVGPELALQIAERFRVAIEQTDWTNRPITASFGVATTFGRMREPGRLIAEADRALYASKHAGRNCVTAARQTRPSTWENPPSRSTRH